MNRPNSYRRRYKCAEACTTCKRRKERCDGNKPCARCIQRRVEADCQYRPRQSSFSEAEGPHERSDSVLQAESGLLDIGPHTSIEPQAVQHVPNGAASSSPAASIAAACPGAARLLQDAKGKYMFIGDSANLSLVRTIRGLVDASIGPCPFVNDPFREQMVETAPEGTNNWLQDAARQPPSKPDYDKAVYLIRRYSLATNCVLDLFDEGELLSTLPSWLDSHSMQDDTWSPIFFLVFAIGAQTCPEDQDALADQYFNYGRLLTASTLMDDPSIATLQASAIIAMYLMGACRRNAAFMYLGTGIRAAYALGLHRGDITALFPTADIKIRERLWKALRTLDMFLSASLGRPPSTEETRDTECDENYSATTHLCSIFEQILSEVYAKRMISTESVQRISERHRHWTFRFYRGLHTDKIDREESVEGSLPNMGLIHIKEAYHWTIILLTRPFFVEFISRRVTQRSQNTGDGQSTPDTQSADQVLVHACVNSAVCTVEMLKILLTSKDVPKRLPFVVNSLFVSGLVLGLAYFGDLYKTYPLQENLKAIFHILALFPHDAIARRNLTILESLLDACNAYVKMRNNETLAKHAHLVSGMFGHMDHGFSQPARTSAHKDYRNPLGHFSSDVPSQQVSDSMSLPASSGGPIINVPDQGIQPSIDLNSVNSSFQYDFSTLPPMSPRTLWFGSYEDNVPLFATFDTRAFNM